MLSSLCLSLAEPDFIQVMFPGNKQKDCLIVIQFTSSKNCACLCAFEKKLYASPLVYFGLTSVQLYYEILNHFISFSSSLLQALHSDFEGLLQDR